MPFFNNIKNIILALGVAMILCSGMAIFANYGWLFELCSHFKAQYIFGFLFLTLYFGALRKYIISFLFFWISILTIIQLNLDFKEVGRSISQENQRAIRLFQFNLKNENKEFEKVINFIVSKEPDLIFLQEFNNKWERKLTPLAKIYPFFKTITEENYGLALYSKFPLEIMAMGSKREEALYILSSVDIQGRKLILLGSHAMSPLTPTHAEIRNMQLEKYGKLLGGLSGPYILTGDLNLTPWSPYFSNLLKLGKLKNSSEGIKLDTTWPSYFSPLRIAIDHFLYSKEIKIVSKVVGPDLGSDHYPVITEFVL
jgi:endonuclease/exonuclease/phosphatase (EEP) superfamily protein YafD